MALPTTLQGRPFCPPQSAQVQALLDEGNGQWIYCGKVKLQRTHGWCPDCEKWSFPADRVLGLRDDSNASPLVQELCALLVSKMPAEQAEALSLRVIGRSLSRVV